MKTLVRSKWIRPLSICVMGATGLWLTSGLGCGTDSGVPGAGGGGGSSNTPTGAILSPTSNVTLENGQSTNIQYFAQSPSSAAKLDIYLDKDSTRGNGNEVELVSGIDVPAGVGGVSGSLTFNSTNVPESTYYVFGQIHYGDSLANTLSFVSVGAIVVVPVGTTPRPTAPTIALLDPTTNLGLTSQDLVQVRYQYTAVGGGATVTLLLDKNRNPNDDDIANPGDPNDPNSKIIILPSGPRQATDPTFGNDPPPPDSPANPPTNVDSLNVRTNPRQLAQTNAGVPPIVKTYVFNINLALIPPRADGSPYYIRASISDGINPAVNAYAPGALTITAGASGVVDGSKIGRTVGGARFQGFSIGEYLGTQMLALGDYDGDTVDDFMLVSRYGAPRNRVTPGTDNFYGVGGAYLFFGRRKTAFPSDTDGDGNPDTRDPDGNVVNFNTPPDFIFRPGVGAVSPYDPRAVGRFGGTLSINSVGAQVGGPLGQFYRGMTYGMSTPHNATGQNPPGANDVLPPDALRETAHPGVFTAGLTSVAFTNLTGFASVDDAFPDFVFGLPYVANPRDWVDDDPCDSPVTDDGSGNPVIPTYGDGLPNDISTQEPRGDEMTFERRDLPPPPINTGLVVMVSGSNDLAGTFRQFVDAGLAGQFFNDPDRGSSPRDEEGFAATPPDGVRIRGAWLGTSISDPNFTLSPLSEYGSDVVSIPSIGNDLVPDLLVSAPGDDDGKGQLMLFEGQDFRQDFLHTDTVISIPGYFSVRAGNACLRLSDPIPNNITIGGATFGDRLGRPRAGGDVNGDSRQDILCGAPGADRDLLTDNGIFYILFNPPGSGFSEGSLPLFNFVGGSSPISTPPPRLEMHGSHAGDRFGDVQAGLGDMDGDGIDDVGFASPFYDSTGSVDRGYVGIIFGGLNLTGELAYRPEDVGTSALPGLRILGTSPGDRAGTSIANAGDFNGDGFQDIVVIAAGEQRIAAGSGETRRGVAYVIFGGPHLRGLTQILLSQVGSAAVPGLVIISPYVAGDPLEAANPPTFETCAGVGDVDGDGLDDIMIGAPRADYVNPNASNQRRPDAGEVLLIYGTSISS